MMIMIAMGRLLSGDFVRCLSMQWFITSIGVLNTYAVSILCYF